MFVCFRSPHFKAASFLPSLLFRWRRPQRRRDALHPFRPSPPPLLSFRTIAGSDLDGRCRRRFLRRRNETDSVEEWHKQRKGLQRTEETTMDRETETAPVVCPRGKSIFQVRLQSFLRPSAGICIFRTRRDNSRRRFDDIDSEGKKRPIRSFEIHPLLPRTSQDAKTRRGSKEVTLGWYGGRPRRRGRPQLYIFNAAHAHVRTQEIGPVRPFVRLTD